MAKMEYGVCVCSSGHYSPVFKYHNGDKTIEFHSDHTYGSAEAAHHEAMKIYKLMLMEGIQKERERNE